MVVVWVNFLLLFEHFFSWVKWIEFIRIRVFKIYLRVFKILFKGVQHLYNTYIIFFFPLFLTLQGVQLHTLLCTWCRPCLLCFCIVSTIKLNKDCLPSQFHYAFQFDNLELFFKEKISKHARSMCENLEGWYVCCICIYTCTKYTYIDLRFNC